MSGRIQDESAPAVDQGFIGDALPAFRPTHVSHKSVEAYPIRTAEFRADGSGKVGFVHPEGGFVVVPVPRGFRREPGSVGEGDMLVRNAPTAEHPDGYLSHSPRAVFEDGYAPASRAADAIGAPADESAGGGLTFGQALGHLKAGARVARAGWNGKGMWLSLSGPLRGREIAFENFWSSNNAEFARLNGGSATVLPCITMKTATGEILMGWLASQTDMLAEDWCVVRGDDRAHDTLGRVA